MAAEPIDIEEYWHAKWPLVEQVYRGRPLPGSRDSFEMDVRRFVWPDDVLLQRALGREGVLRPDRAACLDTVAGQCQALVVEEIEYRKDSILGASEYWLFPAETLALKAGDCEDGAILLASMILNAIPPEEHWRVRVSCGQVDDGKGTAGGHAYVTWCRTTDNEWVVLDWCFNEDSALAVSDKPIARDVPEYKAVWFSFNCYYAWGRQAFELFKRIKGYEVRAA